MSVQTRPIRVPQEMHGPLRTLSGALGSTPGALLHQAFQEYIHNHKDEFVAIFEQAQKYIASSDAEGLTGLLAESRGSRAKTAAAAIRTKRT